MPSPFRFTMFAALGGWWLATAACLTAADQTTPALFVTVAPVASVCERPGITGAGWGVVVDADRTSGKLPRIHCLYPNHPDDWGKTTGTGFSFSTDGGRSWTTGPDNSPLAGMVDIWQDRLRTGELITSGLRLVPDRTKALAEPPAVVSTDPKTSPFVISISRDAGQTWQTVASTIHCPPELGVVARPLPRIIESADGREWLLPAYAWSKSGNRSVLLHSVDRGKNWRVLSTIITSAAAMAAGVPVATPWLETSVERTADGSLLAVMRTASNAQAALVVSRSTDFGRTWLPVEKLVAGSPPRPVCGKLPSLRRLDNGLLALLTAHTKNHCRVYFSTDGNGQSWSDGFVVTSQSGGNASFVDLGGGELIVFTPANGRIHAWRILVTNQATRIAATSSPPTNIVVDAKKGRVTWTAPAADQRAAPSGYAITPQLIAPADGNRDTEIFPYATLRTTGPQTHADLSRVLAVGATYRLQIATVLGDGQFSPTATSSEFVYGTAAAK